MNWNYLMGINTSMELWMIKGAQFSSDGLFWRINYHVEQIQSHFKNGSGNRCM